MYSEASCIVCCFSGILALGCNAEVLSLLDPG